MKTALVENFKLFLANTSIRGFSRIIRTESIFIKSLWSIFIITNTVFMVISIAKVITDYLQYSVNVQTYIKFDNGTPFPAVTFCNHQPFSMTAYKLWDDGHVISPTEFNRNLRKLASRYLKEKANEPYRYEVHDSLIWTTVFDRLSIYYQSMDPESAVQLGHNQSMFHNCMWWYKNNMAFDDRCQDNMLVVKPFSHPSYFTCYTIEPIPSAAMDISRIGAIISLGPRENTNTKHTQGFLFDIFEQAYGLRVALHEPRSYPNIDQIGRQIEPGKLNELSFRPIVNVRRNSPTKPCVFNSTVEFKDLNSSFKYDKELCLNFEIQKRIVANCGCLYGYFARHFFPNSSVNYCGHINFSDPRKTISRMRCVRHVIEDSIELKKALEIEYCMINCRDIEYSLSVSVTKWRLTDWQVFWIKEISEQFTQYQEAYDMYISLNSSDVGRSELEQDINSHIEQLTDYMTRANLSANLHNHTVRRQANMFGDRYSFVIIKRRDNNTILREERFVLTFSALISRIGGLSSLYVGLTFAFFAELIESFYMCLFSSIIRTDKSTDKSNDKTAELLVTNPVVNSTRQTDNCDYSDVQMNVLPTHITSHEILNDENLYIVAYGDVTEVQ